MTARTTTTTRTDPAERRHLETLLVMVLLAAVQWYKPDTPDERIVEVPHLVIVHDDGRARPPCVAPGPARDTPDAAELVL